MRALSIVLLVALLTATTVLTACSSSTQTAQIGDNVSVLYNGTLDDGTVFDASNLHNNVPLQFTIGAHQMISGFDQAVINMSVNQTKTVHIRPEDGYGLHNNNLSGTLNWSQLPAGSQPKVGDKIPVYNAYGQLNGTVLNVSEAGVTVDTNSFLAGQNLTFQITLVKIVSSK